MNVRKIRRVEAPVVKTKVKNLDIDNVKPQRAGVILYTTVEGLTYFGMGLDSKTHQLTDFGGGVIYKKDNDVISGALREFKEETLQIFEEIKKEDIERFTVIYDNKNLIIFIHIDGDPNLISKRFLEKYKEETIKYEPEVCSITWISCEELKLVMGKRGIMYSRVQNFLERADDFQYLL